MVKRFLLVLVSIMASMLALLATAADSATIDPSAARVDTVLNQEMESIKEDLLELRRDLVVLEEDLLFPASSQVAVFVGVDAGAFFQLDAVTLKINGKEVTHHLYTEKQVDALYRLSLIHI